MSKDEAFEEYLVYRGLPACVLMKTDEQKQNYLKTQIKKYMRVFFAEYTINNV